MLSEINTWLVFLLLKVIWGEIILQREWLSIIIFRILLIQKIFHKKLTIWNFGLGLKVDGLEPEQAVIGIKVKVSYRLKVTTIIYVVLMTVLWPCSAQTAAD